MGLLTLGALAVTVSAAGLSGSVAALTACVAGAGLCATGGRVLTNSLALESTPSNTSGATSLMLSAQFVGSALAPLLLPFYGVSVGASFAAAGIVALLGAVLVPPRRRG